MTTKSSSKRDTRKAANAKPKLIDITPKAPRTVKQFQVEKGMRVKFSVWAGHVHGTLSGKTRKAPDLNGTIECQLREDGKRRSTTWWAASSLIPEELPSPEGLIAPSQAAFRWLIAA